MAAFHREQGALATLAAKSSAQNAYMVSCLLANHGFVYLEAPFIVQLLPAMLAAGTGTLLYTTGASSALVFPAMGNIGRYALKWGERLRILGGDGRLGQVTPPA